MVSLQTVRSGPAPSHHIGDELLMDYAAGATNEPESLVIATHLALCPQCRSAVQGLEDVGGALLEDVAPEAVSDDALAALMARIDGEAPAAPEPKRPPLSDDAIAVPEPLRGYLGGGLETVDWQRTMRGLDVHEVQTGRPELKTRLLKIKAGTPMPEHTHHGHEFTLVLTGGYSDERGHFTRGDIDITDDSVQHTPVADAGEDCICLTLTQAPLKLTGRFGRLLNPFVKF